MADKIKNYNHIHVPMGSGEGNLQEKLFSVIKRLYTNSPYCDQTAYPHVVLVAGMASATATQLGGNGPIAYLSGLLHDIGAVVKGPEDHHKTGAEIAGKIMSDLGYPKDVIDAVKYCILGHRGSVDGEKETIEAKCVASADGLCHFHQIPALFKIAFLREGLSSRDAGEWVKNKLERSWRKMLPVHQKMIEERYRAVMETLGEALAW